MEIQRDFLCYVFLVTKFRSTASYRDRNFVKPLVVGYLDVVDLENEKIEELEKLERKSLKQKLENLKHEGYKVHKIDLAERQGPSLKIIESVPLSFI